LQAERGQWTLYLAIVDHSRLPKLLEDLVAAVGLVGYLEPTHLQREEEETKRSDEGQWARE
jgi:hypothetical protein